MAHSAEDHFTEKARNGRPHDTHYRDCPADLHRDHDFSVCPACGCCFGCDDDCCAEYACPHEGCGCSLALRAIPAGKDGGK